VFGVGFFAFVDNAMLGEFKAKAFVVPCFMGSFMGNHSLANLLHWSFARVVFEHPAIPTLPQF
jgi:hypothetical protein